ncbi:MAG TPA: hypothetical protein VNU70_12665 [Puia sp.]|jgi:hypothetical protein|nr:hypothetical protein [Puia sp.]
MLLFTRRIMLLLVSTLLFHGLSFGQPGVTSYLHPGFEAREYLELLGLSFHSAATSDTVFGGSRGHYTMQYRSPEVGMRNRWDLWLRDDRHVAVINIRGTVNDKLSWLENFYAAMAPATGSVQLGDSLHFDYRLSADDKAMVHVGWLLGLAYLAPTMLGQIRQAYAAGVREMIIFGHSQGAALAFLTRSYLYYLQQKGELPPDIVFKTYCSAAPKPGNLFYAYDFDFITRGGWAFTIVNAADWVPETPFTIQTPDDLNPVNPFGHIDKALQKQAFFVRLYIKGKYNKLQRRTRKAQKVFRTTLGNDVFKAVKQSLPGLREPDYSNGSNYQRAGVPIVLEPDSAYYKVFPNDPQHIFQHHLSEAYTWLMMKYYK